MIRWHAIVLLIHASCGLDCGTFRRSTSVSTSRLQHQMPKENIDQCKIYCESQATGSHNDGCAYDGRTKTCTLHAGPIQSIEGGDYLQYFSWCRSTFQSYSGGVPAIGCSFTTDLKAQGWWCDGLTAVAASDDLQCRKKCCDDPACEAWQFVAGSCFVGPRAGCHSSTKTIDAGDIVDRQVYHTISFYPEADTMVAHDTQHLDCNYGKTNKMVVGAENADTVFRGLLKFPVTLPTGFEVSEAKMTAQTLYWRTREVIADVNVNVHEVYESWVEGSGGPDITNGNLGVSWESPSATDVATNAQQAQGYAFAVSAAHRLDNVLVEMAGPWDPSQWVAQVLVSPNGTADWKPFSSLNAVSTAMPEHVDSTWARFKFGLTLQADVSYLLLVSFVEPRVHSYRYSSDVPWLSYPLVRAEPRYCADLTLGVVAVGVQSLHIRMNFVLAKVEAMCGTTDGATGGTRGPGVPWQEAGLGLDGVDASVLPVATGTKRLTQLSADKISNWAFAVPNAFAYSTPAQWVDPENPALDQSYYPENPAFFQFSSWEFNLLESVKRWYAKPVANEGLLLVNAVDQPLGLDLPNNRFPVYPAFSAREGLLPATLQVKLRIPGGATCPSGPFFVDPWSLNVFVIHSIGSPDRPRGADMQGACAVGGDAWFQAFTVNDQNRHTQNHMALYGGANVRFDGGQVYFGGLAAAGQITLLQTGVDGAVLGGSDLLGTGLVRSSVQVQGTVSIPRTNIAGEVRTGVPYTAPLDLTALASYYRCYSRELAALPDSGASIFYEQEGGIIDLQAMVARRCVVTLPAAALATAWQIVLWGPNPEQVDEAVELVINVPETDVHFADLSWIYLGIAKGKVVLNLPNARTLNISGAPHEIVIIAPWAVVEYPHGRLDGQLICDTLRGGNGQFDDRIVNKLGVVGTIPSKQCSCNDGVKNGNEQGVDCGDPECGCPACGDCRCDSFPFDPWTLNVVVMGDVGSRDAPRGADYEGSAAVIGNTWYSTFSVNAMARFTAGEVAHYVGGDCHWTGGQVYKGSLEVRGNVFLSGVGCDSSVFTGANLAGDGGGTISGNVEAAIRCFWCNTPGSSVKGRVLEGVPFKPSLDLTKLQTYFTCASNQLAQRVNSPTPGLPVIEEYGHLTIRLAPAIRNFVTIPAGRLLAAWKLSIVGDANSELVINVPDVTVELDYLEWSYEGVQPGRVILNMPFATKVHISSGPHRMVLLAPWAVLDFSQGVIVGNVIVGQLLGGNGQINDEFHNLLDLPCQGEVCSCPELRNFNCRPCIPGQDDMCTATTPNAALCAACNGHYGQNCWPYDCYCPNPVDVGGSGSTAQAYCRPCTSADPGCTHAGVATQSWCTQTCVDGKYTAPCAPTHCFCSTTVNPNQGTGGQAVASPIPGPTEPDLRPCVAKPGTDQAFCNENCISGMFLSSACTSNLCDCPMGAVPSCQACRGPACLGVTTDAWCEQNCLASLYYGGACLEQYCSCPAGWATLQVSVILEKDPRLDLAGLVQQLKNLTGASAVNVLRILEVTAGFPGRRQLLADNLQKTAQKLFRIIARLRPQTIGRTGADSILRELSNLKETVQKIQGTSFTTGRQTAYITEVATPDLFPGVPDSGSTTGSGEPEEGDQVPGDLPAQPSEEGLSGALLIIIPIVCVAGTLALGLGIWAWVRHRSHRRRDPNGPLAVHLWASEHHERLEGDQTADILESGASSAPRSPPPTAEPGLGTSHHFPATSKPV